MKREGIILRKFVHFFKKMWKKLTFLGKICLKIFQIGVLIFQNRVIYVVKISVCIKCIPKSWIIPKPGFYCILIQKLSFSVSLNQLILTSEIDLMNVGNIQQNDLRHEICCKALKNYSKLYWVIVLNDLHFWCVFPNITSIISVVN